MDKQIIHTTSLVKIIEKVDCGNAPKMQYIKDFCIATAQGDSEKVMDMLSDDICLEIPGYKSAKGKEAVQTLLIEDANRSIVTELTLDILLSHGNHGAANGILKFADGGVVSFCTMYTFSSHSKDAKLKLIQTYSIVVKAS